MWLRSIWPLLLGVVGILTACSQAPFAPVQGYSRDAIPRYLSDWGLFQRRGQQLLLHPDLMPYTLATPLFTDYAQKLRAVWLPPGTAIQYQTAQDRVGSDLVFPVGTIISKTFYYPKASAAAAESTATHPLMSVSALPPGLPGFIDGSLDLNAVQLIETRLLIHQADGWQALPYVWNAGQNDAELALGGDWQELNLVKSKLTIPPVTDTKVVPTSPIEGERSIEFSYVVPDANQCAGCHASNHSSGELQPIGPKLRHLNRSFPYSDGPANQIARWQQLGKLNGLPDTKLWPLAIDASNVDNDINMRARTYLDINCSHCHNPQGPADTSGLFLQPSQSLGRALGLCKPPVAAGKGSGGFRYAIVPGAPAQSILHYRMVSTNPGEMMPELGRGLVHEEGVALIADWIGALQGTCDG